MCLLAAKAIAFASLASAKDLTASGGAADPAALALVETVCPASKRSSLNILLISVMLPYSIPSLPLSCLPKRKRTKRTWNFPKAIAFFPKASLMLGFSFSCWNRGGAIRKRRICGRYCYVTMLCVELSGCSCGGEGDGDEVTVLFAAVGGRCWGARLRRRICGRCCWG